MQASQLVMESLGQLREILEILVARYYVEPVLPHGKTP
jgi:hypothetical protein